MSVNNERTQLIFVYRTRFPSMLWHIVTISLWFRSKSLVQHACLALDSRSSPRNEKKKKKKKKAIELLETNWMDRNEIEEERAAEKEEEEKHSIWNRSELERNHDVVISRTYRARTIAERIGIYLQKLTHTQCSRHAGWLNGGRVEGWDGGRPLQRRTRQCCSVNMRVIFSMKATLLARRMYVYLFVFAWLCCAARCDV